MTVKDVIAHLQTLPQHMEVWMTWDESGEYWPATRPQGRVDRIELVPHRRGPRWELSHDRRRGKAVCVLLPKQEV